MFCRFEIFAIACEDGAPSWLPRSMNVLLGTDGPKLCDFGLTQSACARGLSPSLSLTRHASTKYSARLVEDGDT